MLSAKPKSRDKKCKGPTKQRTGAVRDESYEKLSSVIAGHHLRTFADQRGFAGSLLTVPRHDSREKDQKHSELKRMLQKKVAGLDTEDRGSKIPPKLFSHIKRAKLSSVTQASNLDKSYNNRSASKELLSKVKNLFGTKSTEKSKIKPKKSRDKKVTIKGIDESGWMHAKARSQEKSREASKSSQASNESRERQAVAKRKLSIFYERLCAVVDNRDESHDEKIATISKMFADYQRLLESIDQDGRRSSSEEEQTLRHKILGFFSFYCKMNTKAYLYTRKLVSDSLAHIERFITKEKDTIEQFTPEYFNDVESIDIEEAVKLVVRFATSMVEQNQIMSSYIRKNLKKTEADEILLRRNKPAILKSLMPINKAYEELNQASDSSLSNLEKENDLNQLYDESSHQYKGHLDFEMEEAAYNLVKTYGKKYDDIDNTKTPVTSKLGYYNNPEADLCDSNDYEYSETSKKKTITALARKNSKVIEPTSYDLHGSSKEKKSYPPRNSKEQRPKQGSDSHHRFDDASVPNLMEYTSQTKPKNPPAVDLRLKLSQIKMG